MKKKIAILGSTGSIGKTTIKLIKKDIKSFEIVLLTVNSNINELSKQVRFFNVKNVVITNKKKFLEFKNKLKNKDLNIYNDINSIKKIFDKKIDYTMCSIAGLDGLGPTLEAIKFSKTVAIANKEAIICGWNLIKKKLKLYKTEFIPVDSEHFSIWSLINKTNRDLIDTIYITASGGPFINWPIDKIKNAPPSKALKHPNWSMGDKISIDSATLMNKVFEVIEAQRIFRLDRTKIKMLIHEESSVHAILKLKNGLIKILIHDTNMEIPIFNTLYNNTNKKILSKKINLQILNNLNFKEVNAKKFPAVNFLKIIPEKISLFETILVSANDELVLMYLNKKIQFSEIEINLKRVINRKEFLKYRQISPANIDQIHKLNQYVRLKTRVLCIS